jgi:hypothetical protein
VWEIWQPTQAYTNERSCQAHAVRMSRLRLEQENKYKFSSVCLPDTVNEREPKEK